MKDQEIAQTGASEDVTVESQDLTTKAPDVGGLIQESKKYRLRAQESESRVQELETQIKTESENKLKEQENWQELATKYEEENKSLKAMAEEGQSLKEAIRQDLMDQLSDEDREIAEDLPTAKLQKFVSRSSKSQVNTNESSPGQMPDTSVNPWSEMTPEERRIKWPSIIGKFRS